MPVKIDANVIVGGAVFTADNSGDLVLQSAGVTKLSVTTAGVSLASSLPVSSGGTGASTLTANSVILGNTTSSVKFVTPGNTGNVLTSDGTTWISSSPSGGGATNLDSLTDVAISAPLTTGQVLKFNGTNWINDTDLTGGGGVTTASNLQINSLGVGTPASGTTGEIRATNNITAYYSSDRRLKENIRRIETPINLTKQITGVRFDWTDEYINNAGGEDGYFVRKNDIGVIAQEVEAVLPEIVANRPDGYKAIKYEKLVALLVESVKELDSEVKSINEKLQQLIKNYSNKE